MRYHDSRLLTLNPRFGSEKLLPAAGNTPSAAWGQLVHCSNCPVVPATCSSAFQHRFRAQKGRWHSRSMRSSLPGHSVMLDAVTSEQPACAALGSGSASLAINCTFQLPGCASPASSRCFLQSKQMLRFQFAAGLSACVACMQARQPHSGPS